MFGRGATMRAATEASIGNTWYFLASAMNISLISLTFCGFFSAMSLAWLKSLFRSYSWNTWLFSGSGFAAPNASHGARFTLVLSSQPSW